MSLLTEAVGLQRSKGPRCSVGIVLGDHPEIAADLTEAMASRVTSSALSAALKARQIDLSADTLLRHRRGACRCL